MIIKELGVGKPAIYVDARGAQHNALITCIGGEATETYTPWVNLVLVDADVNKQDSYGRQISRETSVCHKSVNQAWGRYYMMPGDTPNPVTEVQS